jgi:oligopeptide transport system substrate-binding protein
MNAVFRHGLYLLASLVLLTGLLSGCQPGGTVVGQPLQGNVLNLEGVDPQTLDPALSSDANSHQFIVQIFSGLVALGDNLEPVPDIAKSWLISPDGKIYTFYLRQEAKFQDGRPVKAADFKYSWERAADPATGSITAANYLGDIVGVKEKLAGNSAEIKGVRIVDEYVLEVTIDAPKSYFLSKLTYPTAFVVDRANVGTAKDWWRKPNASGPFKVAEWQQSQRLVLEKNSLYYGEAAKLDSVVVRLFAGIPIVMYETGEIDATGVSVSNVERATDTAGPFYTQLSVTPELSFTFIGFNTSKPPFDDPDIRRAFTMAVDKDRLASIVFKDTREPASGILPPGIPGFNAGLSGLSYDPAGAKALVARSKYGSVSNLPPITITTPGRGAGISHSLESVIFQWQENLGVQVRVRQLEPEFYYYNLKQEKDEMFDMGWVADYPHPQNFLDILFRSDSESNYGDYTNPEVDTLLARAATEMDQARSLELYGQVEQKLVDDSAVLPLWFGRNFTLVKPYVKGFVLDPMGMVALNKVSVESR